MTPERINQVIAEFCGIVSHDQHGPLYKTKAGYVRNCPDYYGDLNESRSAVLNLSEQARPYYMQNLFYSLIAINKEDGVSDFDKCTADSPIICRALLNTIGKWEEST